MFLDVCRVKRQEMFSSPERQSACPESSHYIADSFMSVRLTSARYRVITRAGLDDLEKEKTRLAIYCACNVKLRRFRATIVAVKKR